MCTILWAYLRNNDFKKDGTDYHVSADLTGQANHLAATINADIVKQKMAENNGGYNAIKFGKTHPKVYSELTTDHPIDLVRYQVANCYMGRAGLINSGGGSGENDLQQAVRTAVINKRAGGMGLISRPQGLPEVPVRRRAAAQRHSGRVRGRGDHGRLRQAAPAPRIWKRRPVAAVFCGLRPWIKGRLSDYASLIRPTLLIDYPSPCATGTWVPPLHPHASSRSLDETQCNPGDPGFRFATSGLRDSLPIPSRV